MILISQTPGIQICVEYYKRQHYIHVWRNAVYMVYMCYSSNTVGCMGLCMCYPVGIYQRISYAQVVVIMITVNTSGCSSIYRYAILQLHAETTRL